MTGDDVWEYDFHSPDSLEQVANQPELQADSKVLLTPGVDSPDDLSSMDDLDVLDDFQAVFNRETGHVHDCVTDDYEVINPSDVFGGLVTELRERDRTDVSGRAWVREAGALGYLRLTFENTDAIYPHDRGERHPIRAGFETRWSHNGGLSVKVRGFAQDTLCSNSIREVTSPIHVKHSGDVEARIDWQEEWATVLDQMGSFSEALLTIIEDAMDHRFLDFGDSYDGDWAEEIDPLNTIEAIDLPGPITEADRDHAYAHFEFLGLPAYIGTSATDRLMARLAAKDDPRQVSAWDTFSAGTYALTHDFRGTTGASDTDHFRTVNDLLLNPAETKANIEREADRRLAPPAGDEPEFDDETVDLEASEGDAARVFNERAAELEASFGGD